ncbi:hypothetical protein BIY29_17750 [Brenneria alni]|uniref:N-acetyltransferase domain-containing protein n=1 Tax=Brenneria alni TaxID=71656 RepID=A0A421DJH6_9GAMM|nr:GNAT family N-acetyltransferase [Brenneria alni]RLM18754.1 hypothetical protein BIY29_17750 [Brenneria alni]
MTVAKPKWLDEKCPVIEVTTAAEFAKHNIREFLEQIACFYPDFHAWLNFTFVRQLNGIERNVLIIKENGEIAGVSLLKKTEEEKKVCTFFIAPKFQRKGYGSTLMEKSLSYLQAPAHITVCEERWEEMQEFLDKHKFQLNEEVSGYYRPGYKEYFCSTKK